MASQMALNRGSQSFLSVIDANKGIIYKVANAYCRNDIDKEDLIQEIIVQLWLSFHRYDESYKLSTWMYRIALNVTISFYRKERRRTEINQPIPDGALQLTEPHRPGELETDIDLLHRCIRELKEIDRAVIILYLEGNDQNEIGEILGLTSTNVATKVSRIKQQLKQKFLKLKS